MSLLQVLNASGGYAASPDSYSSNLVIAVSGIVGHGYNNVASLINTSTPTFSKFVPRGQAKPIFSETVEFYTTSLELGTRVFTAGWFGFENPSIPAFGTNNFTLETWIYVPSFTGLTQMSPWYYTNEIDNTGFQCFLTGDSFPDVAARRGIYFVGGAGAELNYAGNCLSPNTWHHIAVVRNGSASNSLKIYVDGIDRTNYRNATGNPNWTHTGIFYVTGVASETGWNTVKIQDYRIYQGTAKYTSNFTRPGPMFL